MKLQLIELWYRMLRLWCLIVGHDWKRRITNLADLYNCKRCQLRYRSVWQGGPSKRAWRWWR